MEEVIATQRDSLDALLAEIALGPSGPGVGAFFDFDGTLIDGFSAFVFLQHRLMNREMDATEIARTVMMAVRGVSTEEEFAELLTLPLGGWKGRPEEELDALGEELFREGIASNLFPESWELVAAHLTQGHTVAISSSATRFQIAPLARELGVSHILCTEVEIEDGLITGRTAGRIPYGAGKADVVTSFAAANNLDLASSYAYSNGAEDVAFLATVQHPHVINPDSELDRVASLRGWPVHRFARRSRPGLQDALRTVGAYGGMLSGLGTGAVLGLLNWNKRQGLDLSFGLAGDLGLAMSGVELNVEGGEHLWSQRPAVFVFNHQSSLVDALVIFKLLRGNFSGVAKKEAAAMPLFGLFFQFADIVFVERGDPTKAKEAMAPAVDKLREGVSLAIAPEGTRSFTPRLGAFKKGAFHIAMQAGVPIVPIVIRNSGSVMARGSKTLRPGRVDIVVHPPISVEGWTVENLNENIAAVRGVFLDTLGQSDREPAQPAPPTKPAASNGAKTRKSAARRRPKSTEETAR
ncbi:MAG: HAD-IB family hydrolase [Humibacillus sp.]|nr:HAD-IB family hydrolase [Humibacillus sp.]MDN5779082.1 HAD-IB family hydrolase [Humibacillus sp.]